MTITTDDLVRREVFRTAFPRSFTCWQTNYGAGANLDALDALAEQPFELSAPLLDYRKPRPMRAGNGATTRIASHGDFDDCMSAQEGLRHERYRALRARGVRNTGSFPTGWPTSWRSGARRLTATLPE